MFTQKKSHAELNHVFSLFLIIFLLLMEFPAFGAGQIAGTAPSPPESYPFKQPISKRMAVILIVLVCFFIFLSIVSVYTRQCTEQRYGGPLVLSGAGNNRSRRTARGLDAAVIATFPSFVYSNVKGLKIGKGSLECAVCLCEFEDDETLRLLPKCSHVFHSICIDAWLVSHSTCPVCRASLVPKPGDISFAAILSSDSGAAGDRPPAGNHGSENSHVIVQVAGEDNPAHDVGLISPVHRSTRSRSAGWRLAGIFPRSHSTGHSLLQRGDNGDRFTLRLPEEVRRELLGSNLNRARSCAALPRMQSSRQGYRSGSGNDRGNWKNVLVSSRSGRSDWRTFFPVSPFLRKQGSRSDEVNGGNVDGEDRPFARLRPDSSGQSQL